MARVSGARHAAVSGEGEERTCEAVSIEVDERVAVRVGELTHLGRI